MTEKNERIQILEMIESGTITASDGARLLQALEQDNEAAGEVASQSDSTDFSQHFEVKGDSFPPEDQYGTETLSGDVTSEVFDLQLEKWKRWWMIPLWIGAGFTIVGGLLMLWAYQSSGFGFWFACTWFPFLLGVAMMMMAWGSRSARWLHLRVQQEPGEWPRTIAFSFPLPLRFAAWFMRNFGRYIPKINETGIDFDHLIEVFEETTTSETPFYVEVDEGENGETVQIYIG
jgi:hypothetical protein